MKGVTLFSPAKINLFFRVLNKRSDGYHEIATLIQVVDLGDTLFFELQEGPDTFTCHPPVLSFDPSNLIYRAIELFKAHTGLTFSLNIILHKRIPMQAGLGGGSSNAATTLYALNQLLHTNIPDETLALWGSSLGADVPCFFSQGRVFCEGIGEKLTPVPSKEETYHIIKPKNMALATCDVYKHCLLERTSVKDPLTLLEALQKGHSCLVNDLEEPAFRLLPALKTFKERCQALGYDDLVMTGSGSAIVAKIRSNTIPIEDADIFSVRALYRSFNEWYCCKSPECL